MIPILYESTETAFNTNGLGRLRDMISCIVTEERNGIYECDFEYPVTAEDFNDIQIGRIIGVTHDESDDIQPFDIVSYERPINGVVKFHCTHISYRQSYLTVRGTNISSLADAFARLKNYSTPTNPFTYQTDKTSTGYVGAFDGVPKTVRSMLGGTEGSILDAYGGEYEWDRFNVVLHTSRGEDREFSIRYGVNMVDYNEAADISGTYMACIPYWTDGTSVVVGDKQTASGLTITNRGECIPLDVSERFESKPTKAQVNTMGKSVMDSKNPAVPSQNIHVEFVRLQDSPEYENFSSLLQCKLCDTINVIFPSYNASERFKIVKTVWDVLSDRYESMELGDLSVSLAEALGLNESTGNGIPGDTAIVTLVTKTLSDGLPANSFIASDVIAMTEQEGYKAVSVVGWATSNWRVRPTTNYVQSNTALRAGFANDTDADVSASVTITFRVLWLSTATEHSASGNTLVNIRDTNNGVAVTGDTQTSGKYYFGENNIQVRGIMFTSVDSETTSVPANGYVAISATYTIPNGYTAVLVSANVRGSGTNYTRVLLTAWGTSTEGSSMTLSAYARNMHTSDASISVRFRLLLLTPLS